MKTCKKCKCVKLEDQFDVAVRTKDKIYRRAECKVCHAPNKNKQRANRAAIFQEYKKTRCCEHCGITDYRVLDFHHLDKKEKEQEVSNLAMWRSFDRVMEEIKKCICLCANCHRIHHHEQKQGVA